MYVTCEINHIHKNLLGNPGVGYISQIMFIRDLNELFHNVFTHGYKKEIFTGY